jgi:2-C-methyl-D-erythritol 4-phosphate cytidylyltransferase
VYDDEEAPPALGLVPVEGRGSMPFALLHGESLVAVASWALGEAGVELLDFTTGWEAVQARGVALVVHDPLCPGTPVTFLAEALRVAEADDVVVVGSRPVTDTVKEVDDAGVVGPTHDRDALVEVTSPVVLPARVVAALPALPATDDLADLVAALGEQHELVLLEAPASGRRVADESDVHLLEAMSSTDPD